jgi:hypothetical protein
VGTLQDWSVRAVDVAKRRDHILYAPSKKSYKALAQAHIVLAPHRPWLFFATPISSAINVVMVDGRPASKAARKLRTEHKKPVTALACHPTLPLLLAAYTDGTVRAYDPEAQTLAFVFALPAADPSVHGKATRAATVLTFADEAAGRHLLLGDSLGSVTLWQFPADGSSAPVLRGEPSAVAASAGSHSNAAMLSLEYLPAQRLAVAVTGRTTMHAWSVDLDGGVLRRFELHTPYVHQLVKELHRQAAAAAAAATAAASTTTLHTPAVQLLAHRASTTLALVRD